MIQLESKSDLATVEPNSSADLPTPRDFPQADVVIYDGHCVFCTKQVANLKWLDGKNRLAFISLHDPFVAEHFPDLSHEQLMEQIYLIPRDENGYTSQRLGGAEAIRYLSRRLPKLWVFAPFFHIPLTMPIQQWVYQQIAKRRYRIAGNSTCDKNGTCEVHFKK